MPRPPRCLPFTLLPLLALAGCHINTHKNGDGKENVDIGTPFGSMQVKTDNKASGAQTGMTPYPGATVVKKQGDEDGGAADVSMNFGPFKLEVHAVDLRSTDPEDKVLAFYKQDMSRFGAVLTCRGKTAIGTPVRTGEGLTCGSNQHEFGASTREGQQLELRAGSEQHQHIVGIHTEDGATRIALVTLNLPGSFTHHHDASDRE